jgi:hypothetical protein
VALSDDNDLYCKRPLVKTGSPLVGRLTAPLLLPSVQSQRQLVSPEAAATPGKHSIPPIEAKRG